MSTFHGVRVFCATMIQQRQALGERVTAWIAASRRQHPGFRVVDIVVAQSSDAAFHCVSCVVFFREDSPRTATTEAPEAAARAETGRPHDSERTPRRNR